MELHALDVIAPILVAGVFIFATSLLKEPGRQKFMAVMMAGAPSRATHS